MNGNLPNFFLPCFKSSATRRILLLTLKSLGYNVFECLLTPLQFGIPNSRLRYYLLAKMAPLQFSSPDGSVEEKIWRCIPGHIDDTALPFDKITELRPYLDTAPEKDIRSPYAVPDRVLLKWGRLFDIVLPSHRRTCCFTRGTLIFPFRKMWLICLVRIHSLGRRGWFHIADE